MTRWRTIPCYGCGGHGFVSAYTLDGSDFLGAHECDSCGGTGRLSVSSKGAIAQYPGGPFVGRMTHKELNALG